MGPTDSRAYDSQPAGYWPPAARCWAARSVSVCNVSSNRPSRSDVEVRDAADGTILLQEAPPVRLTIAAFADLELPYGDRTVDIDLTVTAPNQPLASYATIAVYRPVLR